MKYIIFKPNGDIVSQIECLENEIENYLFEGLSFMEYADPVINKKIVGGKIVDKEKPPVSNNDFEIPYLNAKHKRDSLLYNSDWTQVNDSPLTDAKKKQWAEYRQLLRDIPATYPDSTPLEDIIWPTPPEV